MLSTVLSTDRYELTRLAGALASGLARAWVRCATSRAELPESPRDHPPTGPAWSAVLSA